MLRRACATELLRCRWRQYAPDSPIAAVAMPPHRRSCARAMATTAPASEADGAEAAAAAAAVAARCSSAAAESRLAMHRHSSAISDGCTSMSPSTNASCAMQARAEVSFAFRYKKNSA